MSTKKGGKDNRSYIKKDYLSCISKMCLFDDVLMSACFSDPGCAEYLIQVILGRPDLKVNEVHTQHEIKNLTGRSVRLDICATDKNGKRYDVEVQKEDDGAIPERARYHAAMMDFTGLEKNEEFANLRETYIIFITENDVLKGGKPIYTIDRQVKETGKAFNDGMHIIYVNGKAKDLSTELGRLMHDMCCIKADDMYSDILAERVGFFKEEQEGVNDMCKELDEMIRRAEERGEKRGEKLGKEQGEKLGEERGEDRGRLDTIITYINRCKAGGKTEEVIISDLEEYFDYSDKDARELYKKCAG